MRKRIPPEQRLFWRNGMLVLKSHHTVIPVTMQQSWLKAKCRYVSCVVFSHPIDRTINVTHWGSLLLFLCCRLLSSGTIFHQGCCGQTRQRRCSSDPLCWSNRLHRRWFHTLTMNLRSINLSSNTYPLSTHSLSILTLPSWINPLVIRQPNLLILLHLSTTVFVCPISQSHSRCQVHRNLQNRVCTLRRVRIPCPLGVDTPANKPIGLLISANCILRYCYLLTAIVLVVS